MNKPLAKILVVDNDPTVGADLEEMLATIGYEVQVTPGNGMDLINNAIAIGHTFRPHVVILDLRLLDDYSDETSGLQLLEPLSSARCILYSAHLTPGVTRDARKFGAHEWLNKADAPEFLLDIINEATSRLSSYARNWVVRWPESWRMDIVLQQIFTQATEVEAAVLNDLLVQLFPQQQTLYISTVSGAVITMTSPSNRRSVVLKVTPDDQEPQIVKFAEAQQIRDEARNYERYVRNRLVGHFHTHLERSVQFWDVGAALYNFLGTPLNTIWPFSAFYAEQKDTETILKPLHHFFSEVWQRNYRERSLLGQSLYNHYQERFGLEEKLARPVTRELKLRLQLSGLPFEDPIAWMQRHHESSAFPDALIAIVHGDLHGDNLFVDGRYSWAIDFERTGPSHMLRDFAEMELDLLARLTPLPTDPLPHQGGFHPQFVELVKFLMDAHFLSPEAQTHHLQKIGVPEFHKAASTVLGLRTIAKTVTLYQNPREYLWATLFDALFAACMNSTTTERRERAYLVAALICDRLKR